MKEMQLFGYLILTEVEEKVKAIKDFPSHITHRRNWSNIRSFHFVE